MGKIMLLSGERVDENLFLNTYRVLAVAYAEQDASDSKQVISLALAIRALGTDVPHDIFGLDLAQLTSIFKAILTEGGQLRKLEEILPQDVIVAIVLAHQAAIFAQMPRWQDLH